MRSVPRVLVGGLAVASLVALLAACSSTPASVPVAGAATPVPVWTPSASPSSDSQSSLGTGAHPVRVAIVGDSLTAGGGRMVSQGLDQNTWMTYAQGNGVQFVGGWARGGTTVQVQADHVRPLRDVDVLVLMAGTNDVRLHIPFSRSRSSYDRIVDTIDPKHVVIGAIPPYDRDPTAGAAFERQLKTYALEKGWDFTDPWRWARDGERYVAGATNDGIHPTTAGYRIVGEQFRQAILRVVATTVRS